MKKSFLTLLRLQHKLIEIKIKKICNAVELIGIDFSIKALHLVLERPHMELKVQLAARIHHIYLDILVGPQNVAYRG